MRTPPQKLLLNSKFLSKILRFGKLQEPGATVPFVDYMLQTFDRTKDIISLVIRNRDFHSGQSLLEMV